MKRVLAVLVCAVLVCTMISPVFAAPYENSSSTITSNVTELKRGDTFTLTATLTNAEAIKLCQVKLNYNDAVFELTGGACLIAGANPAVVIPAQKVGTGFMSAATVISGDIFTFEFKVKENAPFGDYTIENISAIGTSVGERINATNATISVVCDHVLADNWTQDDATNHKKECTVDGCDYKDTEAHSFGSWESADANNHKRTCTVATCGHVETQTHTYDQQKTTDTYKVSGASCTEQAVYNYSCICGAKGDATFKYGDLLEHVYDQTVATDAYKVSGATCTEQAVYNYSCVCGAKGDTTFKYGNLLDHVYDQTVATDDYKVSGATCTEQAVYNHSCYCGARGTTTFKTGALLEHVYDKTVATDDYLVSAANCQAKAVYNHSCVCGKKGDTTFTAGELGDHVFDKTVATDAFKVSGATCTEQAVYNHSCFCGERGTTTFKYGDLLAHTYDQTVATDDYKATNATCLTQATYYKSCSCGAKGTETFAAGELAPHTFNEWVSVDGTVHSSVCAVEGCVEPKTEEHKFSTELTAGKDTHWYACVCGDKKDEAAHVFDETKWASDAEGHWHTCACGAKTESVKHNWDAGKVTKEPSTKEEGEKTYTCTDCGTPKTEKIPQLETPKNGDDFMVLPLVLLVVISALGMAAVLLLKKRQTR